MRRLRPWALVPVLGALLAAGSGSPSRSYPHSALLDGAAAYLLRWGRRGSALAFRLEVRTRGYVGFGLSASGGMASADIVVGGVEGGQPYLQVRTGSFPETAPPAPLLNPALPRAPLPRQPPFPDPRFSRSPPVPCLPHGSPGAGRVCSLLAPCLLPITPRAADGRGSGNSPRWPRPLSSSSPHPEMLRPCHRKGLAACPSPGKVTPEESGRLGVNP